MKSIHIERPKKKEKRGEAKSKIDEGKYFVDHPESSNLINKRTNQSQFAAMMDIKAKRGSRLKEQRVLFISIGFCLSLLLTIGAFEWKIYSDQSTVALEKNVEQFDDLVDVPQTEQPPPPPPKVEEARIVEVEDEQIVEDVEINLDIDMTEETKVEDVVVDDLSEDVPEEEADEIFTIVEDKPTPKDGMQSFYSYIGENLKYPTRASKLDIEGKVFVQFVVEKDGSLTDFEVVRGIGAGCDKEAIRVLSEAPKWNPGKQRGRPVRVRMILPITFKLVR